MRIEIDKTDDDNLTIRMPNEENAAPEFSYPEFVRRVYGGDLPIDLKFSEGVDELQKEKLRAMMAEIEAAIVPKTDDADPDQESEV